MSLPFKKIMQQASKNREEMDMKIKHEQPSKSILNMKFTTNGATKPGPSSSVKMDSGGGPSHSAIKEFLAKQKAEQMEEAKRKEDERRRLLAARMKEKDKSKQSAPGKSSDKNVASTSSSLTAKPKLSKKCKPGEISFAEETRSLERRKAEEFRTAATEKVKSSLEANRNKSFDKRTATYSKAKMGPTESRAVNKKDDYSNSNKKDVLKSFKIPSLKKAPPKESVDFSKLMEVAVKNRDHGPFDDDNCKEPLAKKRKLSDEDGRDNSRLNLKQNSVVRDSEKFKKQDNGGNYSKSNEKLKVDERSSNSKGFRQLNEKTKVDNHNNGVKLKTNNVDIKRKHPMNERQTFNATLNVSKASSQMPDKKLSVSQSQQKLVHQKPSATLPANIKLQSFSKTNVPVSKLEQAINARKAVNAPKVNNGFQGRPPLPKRPGTPPKTVLPRRPGTPPGSSKVGSLSRLPANRSLPTTYAKPGAKRSDEARARELRREMMFKHPERFAGPHRNGGVEDLEDEEDSDMDSFIDDTEYGDGIVDDYSEEICRMFKYDPRKFKYDDRDDPSMEASYKDIEKEEARSARLGMMEDLEDIQREMDELKRKGKKKPKNTLY